ncbi:MarR family 2-MHQ and catechol resistance regulon transcriptional repressor [Deinococcus metalli]|uniref:MarR family 2-MHQ and catechol resistance regulon transcriptional repressor n=1 Tax=Deinococcus metalli TaxID=1141878 RepID=A0A7W8NPQ5_9DEIO|nr:MarR family transcriptional regulator [Deinococcus metalli]MBB5377046.1 MarR family 2-MHQ and catechol resistance regulon transcriptional repressor [Deinococcus metalli]GHF49338.1 MarR family transcriptional regulator [Deinococcus metalli]
MANRYAGTEAERGALDAYVKLWRAAHAVEVAANRHLMDHNLTTSQFAVLEALYHLGPLSQRHLADKILRSSGNLTMVIDNLERDGLVRRERVPSDRRVVSVTLTAAGQALIARVLPKHVQGIHDIFGVLDSAELASLSALTRKLGHAVSRRLDADALRPLGRGRPGALPES